MGTHTLLYLLFTLPLKECRRRRSLKEPRLFVVLVFGNSSYLAAGKLAGKSPDWIITHMSYRICRAIKVEPIKGMCSSIILLKIR